MFKKANDHRAVVREVSEISMAYGVSDEFRYDGSSRDARHDFLRPEVLSSSGIASSFGAERGKLPCAFLTRIE